MFTELSETIREEVLRHLFHVKVDPAESDGLRPQPMPAAANGGNGNLVYEHESLAGSEAILAAGAAGGAALAGASAGQPARHEQRIAHGVRPGRAQRSLPLRLRQEVQEMPRRIAA